MSTWREVMDSDSYVSFKGSGPSMAARRPAVLVIDVVKNFLGEPGLSREDSVAGWPLSCGPAGWAALPNIRKLVEMARERGFPVIYTVGDPGVLGGATKSVVDNRPAAAEEAREIPALISPAPGDPVVRKTRASAFFGTPLAALLIQHGVDSLIMCGCTTSGCVRASVVDGHSFGWPVVVAEDASFDRAQLSHDVSLFEMNAKYAVVKTVDEIAEGFSPTE